MKVNEAIEILKTMPQEAELVGIYDSGIMEMVHSIHTQEVISALRDVKLTVVAVDLDECERQKEIPGDDFYETSRMSGAKGGPISLPKT